jgi:hypothetical protein
MGVTSWIFCMCGVLHTGGGFNQILCYRNVICSRSTLHWADTALGPHRLHPGKTPCVSEKDCRTLKSFRDIWTTLHCTALHCTVEWDICPGRRWDLGACGAVTAPIQFPALHCTALHCTALHCTALHCTALHCTALHCTVTALHWASVDYALHTRSPLR